MTAKCKLSVDLKKGETLSIEGGRILLTVEEKSGQRARLRFEFQEHTVVLKLPAGLKLEQERVLGPT